MDEIIYADERDYSDSIALMEQYKYNINYSDCLIILSV